jgi:hypothetical protein
MSISTKKLLMYFFVALFLIFSYKAYSLRPLAYDANESWMDYITESCKPTFNGKLKSFLYGELDLWVHVSVLMDSWAEKWHDSFQNCNIHSGNDAESNLSKLRCISFYQHKWDWFGRCGRIVKYSCNISGGKC